MNYVMVPVPEELAQDAKQFLMSLDMRALARRPGFEFEQEALERILRAMNPRSRTALSHLAAGSATGRHLTISQLALETGWTEHEASGVLTELKDLVWTAFGPVLTTVADSLPDPEAGVIDWNVQRVILWAGLADAVVAVDARAVDGA